MVEQELREQPARPVGVGDLVRIVGQAGEQRGAELLGLGGALGRLARLLRLGPRRLAGPQRQQPVAELERRDAVLLVVGGDVVEDLRVAPLEPVLVEHDRVVAGAQVGVALEVERLDLLEPVALVREAQPLRDDLVEVDEDLAAEQVVELLLARPVLAGEPLQRGDLVGGVVVDVHRGVGGAALADQVDHALDGAPLLRAVVRPERTERPGGVDDPPEVLEPAAGLPERVALDVEEEVAVARRRQQLEPARGLGREHLPRVPVRARGDLHRRLVAQRLEGARRHRRRARLVGRVRELRDGRDALALEPPHLVAAHPRDEAEVVVGAPARLAALLELAAVAERDRQRVDVDPRLDRADEPLAHAVVVGEEVGDAQALALVRAEHDVHPLGHRALDPRDLLGVEAELQHVGGLRVARELRVDDLVAPVRLPLDEVGEPAPAAVDEAGLVDHVGAGAHRLLGRAGGGIEIPVVRDRDDVAPVGEQRREVGGLVLVALALDEVGLRILVGRPLELVPRNRELELRQVLALEERVQVRGREPLRQVRA